MREQIDEILQSSPAAALGAQRQISSYPELEITCRISDLLWAHQQLATLLEIPDDQLKAAFEALAAQRWGRIQGTTFCYSLEPDSPANSLYRQIFALLYPDTSFFDSLRILMPTVKTLVYPQFEFSRTPNGVQKAQLRLLRFNQRNSADLPSEITELDEIIIEADEAFCVPVLPRQNQLLQVLHKTLEEQAPAFLRRLMTHNLAIAKRFEILLAESKTIRQAISEFAERLKLSGSRVSGQELALNLADSAVYAFQRYLDNLPPKELALCKAMTTSGNQATSVTWVLETHLIQNRGCVEIASNYLNSILANSANNAILDFKPPKQVTKSKQDKKIVSSRAQPLRPINLPSTYVSEALRTIRLPDMEAQALFFQRFSPDFYPQLADLIDFQFHRRNLTYILLHLDEHQTHAFLRVTRAKITGLFTSNGPFIRDTSLLSDVIENLRAPLQRDIFIEFCLETKELRFPFLKSSLFNRLSLQQRRTLERHLQISDFFAPNDKVSIHSLCFKLPYFVGCNQYKYLLAVLPKKQLAAAILTDQDLLVLKRDVNESNYNAVINEAIEEETLASISLHNLEKYLTAEQIKKWQSKVGFLCSIMMLSAYLYEDQLKKIDPSHLNALVAENLDRLASKKLKPAFFHALKEVINPELYERLIAHIANHFNHLAYDFLDAHYWSIFNSEQQSQIIRTLSDDQRLQLIRQELLNSIQFTYFPQILPSSILELSPTSIRDETILARARVMQSIISQRQTTENGADFFAFVLNLNLEGILTTDEISSFIGDWVLKISKNYLVALTAKIPLCELARRAPSLLKSDVFDDLPRANVMRNYADFKFLCRESTEIKSRALRERWLQELELNTEDYRDILTQEEYLDSLSPTQQNTALTQIVNLDLGKILMPILIRAFSQTENPDFKKQVFKILSSPIDSFERYCEFIHHYSLPDEIIRGLISPEMLEQWDSKKNNIQEWAPLLHCIEKLSDEALLDISERFSFNRSLLSELITQGKFEAAKALTERFRGKELSDKHELALLGWGYPHSLLYFAIKIGNLEAVKYFANLTERFYFKDRQSVLHVAAEFNHPHLITYFLNEYGTGILNLQTAEGKSALTLALEKGHERCCEILSRYKPRIEVQDLIAYLTLHNYGGIEHNLRIFERTYQELPRVKKSIQEFRTLLVINKHRPWVARLFSKPSPLVARFAENADLKAIHQHLALEDVYETHRRFTSKR